MSRRRIREPILKYASHYKHIFKTFNEQISKKSFAILTRNRVWYKRKRSAKKNYFQFNDCCRLSKAQNHVQSYLRQWGKCFVLRIYCLEMSNNVSNVLLANFSCNYWPLLRHWFYTPDDELMTIGARDIFVRYFLF